MAAGFHFTETFTATAKTALPLFMARYGNPPTLILPKIPVIDQSYTGPHTNMFPRTFMSTLARNNQAMAELGFIVVCVDGMGTAGRSKAFHNVSYKNMGKNLTDHVLAIKRVGKKYAWVDADRVGILAIQRGWLRCRTCCA